MKMIFDVHGSTEVIELVAKFLGEKADFTFGIENDSPDAGDMEITFDESHQSEYVPYFMKWLHFEPQALTEHIKYRVSSCFKSIST